MTPAEKMALVKRHSFTEWTSLVGCKAKPRQLSRWQYIVTGVNDRLYRGSQQKLVVPQVSLRLWDNGPTMVRYPLGHLDRYGLHMGYGAKSMSLISLLDNYDLFHLTDRPVQQTVLDWDPIDHTRDTRTENRVYRYRLNDSRFVVEIADLFRIASGMGIRATTRTQDDQLIAEFTVSKRKRKTFLALAEHKKDLMEPWPTPTDTI